MDPSAESFELVNWKLDLVKSHFSSENKPRRQPVLDQKSILDSVKNKPLPIVNISLIQEPKKSVPLASTAPIIKKKEEAKVQRISLQDISKTSFYRGTNTPELSGSNDATEHWQEFGDTIRPLEAVSSTNSRIITPDEDTDKDESFSEIPFTRNQNSAKSYRPKLIRNECQFPVSLESLGGKNDHDQGRNCVVVIFKSKTTDSMMARERTLLNNKKEVDKILKKYKLKYDFSYSSQIRAIYNLCFYSPTETRKFVRDLSDISAKISGPKALHNFLCHEEMLGYQYIPVLTEQEMLTLHSPEYVDNVLSTKQDVKVVMEADDKITFVFKTVMELNVFIHDKCAKETAKTLGELKANVSPLKLVYDEDGLYRVISKDPRPKLEPFAEKYRFELKEVRLAVRTLCFCSKVELYEFLLDENTASIRNLLIDKNTIVKFEESSNLKSVVVDPSDDLKCLNEEKDSIHSGSPSQVRPTGVDAPLESQVCLGILDVEDDEDSVLNDSCATEASVYEAVIAQKDDEIRLLKSQLSQKDDVIRRRENENRKMESKLFDSQDVLTQVTKIITNNNSLQHVIPQVRETLNNNGRGTIKRL